jgi:hypothetical protein
MLTCARNVAAFALRSATIAIICGVDFIRRFGFECCQIFSHSTLLTLLLGLIDLGRHLTVIAARVRFHDARIHRKHRRVQFRSRAGGNARRISQNSTAATVQISLALCSHWRKLAISVGELWA